ncbi:MAG TPA: hypothetical protein PLS49_00895 [Candidatus Woesebacteria bacterium]|nr:hypothetical protein [Candidatus Woesebacteria bacterium]
MKNITNKLVNDPYSLTIDDFYKTDIDDWNKSLNKNDRFWLDKGKQMAINLFHVAVQRVPAYKDFLKKNKVNPNLIKSTKDFQFLPIINKKNYLTQYPLKDLVLDGNLKNSHSISVSSGSTGHPFFWPRGPLQEFDTTLSHELFLKYIFEIDKKSTLLIVAYSMGMYVAGPFTFSSAQRVAMKGYPLTVVTPSINKKDVLRVIKNLSGNYEQTIIAGYPPFVKDILDAGKEEKIDFFKLKMKFIFGAENFSEEWRHFILNQVNSDSYYKSSMNTYGSADAAILGHESPLSILTRLATIKAGPQNSPFIDNKRLPSLNQYNPVLRYFESIENKLIFTAAAGIPLIRYDIGDNGGILTYEKVVTWLKNNGVNPEEIFRKNKMLDSLWKLPFVYLYGRRDFTVTLYGLNIYPENIKNALLYSKIVKKITGKFILSQEYDNQHNQFLQIKIELQDKIKNSQQLMNEIKNIIIKTLAEQNREYAKLYESIGVKAEPIIILEEHGNNNLFVEGVKQKWVQKK